jgi:hypothetical protein
MVEKFGTIKCHWRRSWREAGIRSLYIFKTSRPSGVFYLSSRGDPNLFSTIALIKSSSAIRIILADISTQKVNSKTMLQALLKMIDLSDNACLIEGL